MFWDIFLNSVVLIFGILVAGWVIHWLVHRGS
jgi:hypothetical protein